MKLKTLIFLFLLAANYHSQAQEATKEVWTLQKCIDYALQNSLLIQQGNLAEIQSQLNQKQAFWAQFPTLNGSFRHGANFGRSIDYTSYSFVNQVTHSSAISLSLNQTLFQGFQIKNTIRQSHINREAATQDQAQTKNDIALQIAQAYLSILLAQENAAVLNNQATISQQQYQQTLKLIAAGVLAENSKYDLEAQLARDEENIVMAENAIELSYLNLKVLMNIDIVKSIDIEKIKPIKIDESISLATLETVYKEAVNNQPAILAAKLRERSATLGVQIAKGALYPNLSLYGNLSTNFSSAARGFAGIDTSYSSINGRVISNQDPVQVDLPSYKLQRGDVIPYFMQLGGNTAGNIGLNLSIPIFNGMRSRINIQKAELAVQSAQLTIQQKETSLKSNIDRALTDVKAAIKKLKAATKSVIAIRMSVQNTRKRYDLGVVNAFELTSVQNTLTAAESNLLQAKYDYLFKIKILDYYQGKPIN